MLSPNTNPIARLNLSENSIQQISSCVQNRLGYLIDGFRIDDCTTGVTLWGRVSTYYSKQLAQEVVKEQCGNTIVINHIEVDLPGPGCVRCRESFI
jgi:hypothetical protein